VHIVTIGCCRAELRPRGDVIDDHTVDDALAILVALRETAQAWPGKVSAMGGRSCRRPLSALWLIPNEGNRPIDFSLRGEHIYSATI
jgi:hypothetical protein